jgi:hypothetical protein
MQFDKYFSERKKVIWKKGRCKPTLKTMNELWEIKL